MVAIFFMVAWAIVRILSGTDLQAESAHWDLVAEGSFTGFALLYLVARSFTSGTTALTGVEAISNGVPAFRKPKSKNAATTLLMLGVISVTLFMGIIMLARATGVQIAERPNEQLVGAPANYHQKTLIAQLADAV